MEIGTKVRIVQGRRGRGIRNYLGQVGFITSLLKGANDKDYLRVELFLSSTIVHLWPDEVERFTPIKLKKFTTWK